MQKVEGTTIKINRGDVLNLTLTLQNADGTAYTFHNGDKIVFSIYDKSGLDAKAVLLKEIDVLSDAQSVSINLTNNETKIGELINKPVEYWYEIELNDQFTIIGYDDDGAKIFKLYPEGSKLV